MNLLEIYPIVFITFIFLAMLLYWFLTKNFNYWTERGLKGPKPTIIFGNYIELALKQSPLLDLEWYKKFGNIYGIFAGYKPVLRISDPELIKIVLIEDFNIFMNKRSLNTFHPIINSNLFHARDKEWKRFRKLMNPLFKSGKLKRMYPMIEDCVNTFICNLNTYGIIDGKMNIINLSECFTIDVIASCVFAIKINSYQEPNNPVVVNGRKLVNLEAKRVIPSLIFPLFINKLLNIQFFTNEDGNKFFFDLTRNIIENRSNSNNEYDDFIHLMQNASTTDINFQENDKDYQFSSLNEKNENSLEINPCHEKSNSKRLSENEIIAQCWTLFSAGFETTALTISFCAYELAVNSELQEILYNEIVNACDYNYKISFEKISKLPYLNAIVSETLRKYPPVIRTEREVSKNNYELGNSGLKLKAGQPIEIMIYALHHCEEYYPNPEKFIPERFLLENRNNIIPYTYLPFGTGPRNCIGMKFGLLMIKSALSNIIRQFKLVRTADTEIPLRFKKSTFLCSVESIKIGLEKRF